MKLPSGLIGTFAVVKPWPDIQAAEDEVIARLKVAANLLDLSCLVITPEGEIIGSGEGERISARNCDFVINLHFDKPKNYEVFSFVALWNPLEFYHVWGYNRVSRHLLTHDDFLSCGSPWADDQVRRMISGKSTHLAPQFNLYHSVAEPILKPAAKSFKLFYAGINWERLGKGPSRHQELLKKLDGGRQLRIFGPKLFQGVDVWEGYKSYQGQVPFDGVSMIREIAQCGASLVLSSEAHKQSEMMSNRLFESLAAGALVICDENPFARRYFGDTLLYIDSRESVEAQSKAVMKYLRWANDHPKEACKLASEAQNIFLADFKLEKSLSQIYLGFSERRASLNKLRSGKAAKAKAKRAPRVEIFVIVDELDSIDFELQVSSIANQSYRNFILRVLVKGNIPSAIRSKIDKTLLRYSVSYELKSVGDDTISASIAQRPMVIGQALSHCINSKLQSDYVLFVAPHERMMSNHLEVLVGSAIRNEGRSTFATASIVYHVSNGQRHFDYIERIEFSQERSHLLGLVRFMFDTRKIRSDVNCALPYLDSMAVGALIQETVSIEPFATAIIDISQGVRLAITYEQQRAVLSEYSPWIFPGDPVSGYSVPAEVDIPEPFISTLNKAPREEKVAILGSLLEAAFPPSVIQPIFKIYDGFDFPKE